MLLPQLSHIYWLIHFKAINVNGNSYIEDNSTDSLQKFYYFYLIHLYMNPLYHGFPNFYAKKNDSDSFASCY